ncbi:MAG: flagellar hook-length control protein FliK [Hyphomicrobiales bacterium]|nr:flagellar hook-length control protein FliK [Hyphomicrobiales bacterium]
MATPVLVQVPPLAEAVAAIILPVEGGEASAPNPSAPPAGNAVVATPAISVPDKTVVAPLPSGLPAPDAASESLSQQPATAVVAQSGLKAGVKAQKPGDGLPAELIAGDKGASELAQRVEQPQQAQAAQAAVHRPAEGSQLDTLLSNLQVAANPSAPPASILQPPRPEGAEAHLAKAIPPSAVPIEIGLRALQGAREFQIRLDPAELGRVDVRLEIGDDKSVSAKVVVDRVETLHLLQREARTLERAFEQAGLKSSDSGIDITLRDHGQQSNQQRSEAFTDEIGGRARKAAAAPTILPADIPVRRSLHVGALDRSI